MRSSTLLFALRLTIIGGLIVGPVVYAARQQKEMKNFRIVRDDVELAGAPGGNGCKTAGTPEVTGSAGLSQSPRFSIWVSRGSSRLISVRAVDPAGHSVELATPGTWTVY